MPTIQIKAEMVCDGCSGAIGRIVKKIDGVEEVTFDGVGGEGLGTVNITIKDGEDAEKAKGVIFEKLQKWGEMADKKVSMD
uniref:HMA domain-containing protein n=1 Tax=Karlodinium veneficum TaxID=407301 RepID=A7WPY2_KARVE|nr:unknown [Karlodinium veneficum]ABV22293.1 unknown [Karlodinium veneficum]